MNLSKRENWTGYMSIIPSFLFMSVLFFYPTVNTFVHSFTRWDGLNAQWIALENYIKIFTNGQLWMLLRSNFIFLAATPVILMICLIVTVLLFEEVRWWRFFRSVYYLPTILSAVVVGFLMKILFSQYGTINTLLSAVGMGGWTREWLGSVSTAFMVLIFCYFWQTLGQGVLVFLSGMSSISSEVFEAAKIDGATWGQRLFRIIMPSLVPALFYFTFINVTWVFVGLFPLIYSVTGGGPGYGTTPIDYMIYLKGFRASGEMGYASALSVNLFFIVLFFAWLQFRVSERLSQ